MATGKLTSEVGLALLCKPTEIGTMGCGWLTSGKAVEPSVMPPAENATRAAG